MHRLADLAAHYGSGEVRLTVWQNLILPHIPEAFVDSAQRSLVRMGCTTPPAAWRGASSPAPEIPAANGPRPIRRATPSSSPAISTTGSPSTGRSISTSPAARFLRPALHRRHRAAWREGQRQRRADRGLPRAARRAVRRRAGLGREVFHGIPFPQLPALLERILRTYSTGARRTRPSSSSRAATR